MDDERTQPQRAAPAVTRAETVPWGFLDAAAVFLIAYLLIGIASPLLRSIADPELARGIFFPVSFLLLGGTTVAWVAARHRGHVAALVGRVPTPADVGWGIAHGVVAFLVFNLGFSMVLRVVTDAAGAELPEVQQGLRQAAQDGRIGLLVIFSAILAAPLAEELFFRGLLFQGLSAQVGRWPGIAVSGFIFGLAHAEAGNAAGTLYALLVLACFGMYLAWVLDRRRTLVSAIAMHATFNALAVVGILIVPGAA